jgi:hypothetical protein
MTRHPEALAEVVLARIYLFCDTIMLITEPSFMIKLTSRDRAQSSAAIPLPTAILVPKIRLPAELAKAAHVAEITKILDVEGSLSGG